MYFFSQLLSYRQLISEWRILNQTYYRTKGNEKKNTPCTKRHLAIKELLSNPMKRSGGRKKKKNPKEEEHRVLGLLFYRLFLASGPRALTLLLRNAWPILHDEALLARTCIYVLLCCWPGLSFPWFLRIFSSSQCPRIIVDVTALRLWLMIPRVTPTAALSLMPVHVSINRSPKLPLRISQIFFLRFFIVCPVILFATIVNQR